MWEVSRILGADNISGGEGLSERDTAAGAGTYFSFLMQDNLTNL